MKLRNKTLKSLHKGVAKRKDFRCLTNNVGKGKKQGLRKVEVVEGDEIISIRNKDEMERLIIKHNRENFSKGKNTKACEDKTCNSTRKNETRDLTLNGELKREDCDEEEVYEFLRLLKRPKR